MRFALLHRAEKRTAHTGGDSGCVKRGIFAGFTLIELTIYVGIVAMILVALIFTTSVMYDARARVRTSSIVHEHISYAVERVVTTIRESSGVMYPAAGAASTTLRLTMPDSSMSPMVFSVTSSRIYLQVGTEQALPITSNEVQITSATFTVSNADPPSVRVQISGDKTNAHGEYSSPFTLSETATIRQE